MHLLLTTYVNIKYSCVAMDDYLYMQCTKPLLQLCILSIVWRRYYTHYVLIQALY